MKARRKYILKPSDPVARREETRRFAANVSKAIIVIGAVVALVVVANRWGAREELQSVRIVGRVVLDSSEIMERAGIHPGATLRGLDLDEIERRLAAHPFLSRVAAYRGAGGTLVVEIVERTPVALCVIDGTPTYLDSQAVALPFRFSSATFDVPVVAGITEGNAASDVDTPGNESEEKGVSAVPSASGTIDSARAREALQVVAAIRGFDETLYRQIAEIRREPNGEYTLVAADGALPIRAGLPLGIETRLEKLDLFWKTVLASRGVDAAGYVDLRWEGQVVVRWRDAVAMAEQK